MKRSVNATLLPSLEQPLKQLGQHIRLARQSRNWTLKEAALRTVVSESTYKRIEAGDPKVSMGYWVAALQQLKLFDQIVKAAAPAEDRLGEALRANVRRKRVRKPKEVDKYDF